MWGDLSIVPNRPASSLFVPRPLSVLISRPGPDMLDPLRSAQVLFPSWNSHFAVCLFLPWLALTFVTGSEDSKNVNEIFSWHLLYSHVFPAVYRAECRCEDVYTWYSRYMSWGRHLYSGYTLRVLGYSSQELHLWMQSRILRWRSHLHRWDKF